MCIRDRYNSILSVVVYTTENTNVINDLSEISRANCERYIIDKRWEEGWKKLSTGAFAMMSGAGALGVALGKAGVLLKVLGFVTGPTAAIFGGAEAAEGLQDIYISVDELDKEAVNKIKARLGEDAYYKILYGSTIASDFVCLAGYVSELNAVPGSLEDLPSGNPGKAPEIGGESGRNTGTVWDNITSTADNMPATEIPDTFKIDLDGNINYVNPETGTNTLWTNSNATKHMGEYVGRFGDESWSIGTRSQVMLESYSASLNKAMEAIGTGAPGRYFGTYGNWELGINTETGVVYHARMIN